MKIDKFTEALLPTIARETILEDCRMTISELKESVIPTYQSSEVFFKGYSFKSAEVINMAKLFKSSVPGGENMMMLISKALPKVEENVTMLKGLVGKSYSDVVATSSLTYSNATMLQLIEYCGFFTRYARRLMNFVFVMETAEFEGGGVDAANINDNIPPAEQAWVRQNFTNFLAIFEAVGSDRSKTTRALETIPDIQVTKDNYATLEQTMGQNKIDPLKTRFIGTRLNPFLFFGEIIAGLQANRYKVALRDKELAELRLLNLQMISKGKADAKIQKEIQYYEGLVQNLEASIAKMEKDYA